MKKIIMIGAGGHAKSVLECIDKRSHKVVGFIDAFKKGTFLEYSILGDKIEDINEFDKYYYFVTIGDNKLRQQYYAIIKNLNLKLVNIIDSSAYVSGSATIGEGCFVGKMAIINAEAKIGDNCIINNKALVEHECVVGNHTHISTNTTVNGNVEIGDNVFLGSGSVTKGQISIGNNVIVGAGSVVVDDINDNVLAVGVPAKKKKSL